MTPRIFATGTTGYVGGDVLYAVLQSHPDWEASITCFARSPARAKSLSSAYPKINVVSGSLEDSALLEEEASKADIVLNFASSDHVGAATAIKNGMEKGKGGYLIHTSGTDILLNPGILNGGEDVVAKSGVKVWNDVDNIKELTLFPDTHSHRPCDRAVLSCDKAKVKTAVVCPPTIWGTGRGAANQRSIQIYNLAQLILERGSAIKIPSSDGVFWPNIHIFDLTRLYLHLIDAAAAELEGGTSNAVWDEEGYYFAENGIHYWQQVADWVAEEARAKGYIKEADRKEVSAKDLKIVGPAIWNLGNSCKHTRARKLFGWVPKEGELKDEIEEIVAGEAKRAGIPRKD